ncbi:MAG TPA: hypothetical protein VMQ62_08080, partial [Dongiaceae bacterium]|nr:hypothetical protein [Dongiaceae bacterium]
FYGVLGILVMQFLIMTTLYGFDLSIWNLGTNALKFYVLCFILITGIGNLALVKNKWRSIFSREG